MIAPPARSFSENGILTSLKTFGDYGSQTSRTLSTPPKEEIQDKLLKLYTNPKRKLIHPPLFLSNNYSPDLAVTRAKLLCVLPYIIEKMNLKVNNFKKR
jgi:hypothetical protein